MIKSKALFYYCVFLGNNYFSIVTFPVLKMTRDLAASSTVVDCMQCRPQWTSSKLLSIRANIIKFRYPSHPELCYIITVCVIKIWKADDALWGGNIKARFVCVLLSWITKCVVNRADVGRVLNNLKANVRILLDLCNVYLRRFLLDQYFASN